MSKRVFDDGGKQESKKLIAFPIQLFAESSKNYSELPDEIHVVPTGKWDHPAYGEMEITTAHIAEFVKNFKDKVRLDIPITAGHDNGMSGGELPAIGWFREVYDRGVNGLYAFVEWTEEGKKLLSERAFKYFSPEFYEQYTDPETGEKYSHVLVGGALTNKPYFKELDAVVAFSEPKIIEQFISNEKSMNLKDLLAKKYSELTKEEKAFIVANKEKLSASELVAMKQVFDEEAGGEGAGEGGGEGGNGGGGAGDGGGSGDGNGDGGTDGDGKPVAASEKGVITMSEAEAKVLRDKADAGQKAFDELQGMKVTASVEKMVFSETNANGRFKPNQKDALVTLMKSLSEKQREQFINLVNNMPKTALFSELGDGGNAENNVAKEVETAVQAKIKASEGKMKYSTALKAVFAENADLEKRYNESIGSEA